LAIRPPLILAKVLCFVVAGHSKWAVAPICSGVAGLHPEFIAFDFPLIIARTPVFKAGTRVLLHVRHGIVKLSTFCVYSLPAVHLRTLHIALVVSAVAAVAIAIAAGSALAIAIAAGSALAIAIAAAALAIAIAAGSALAIAIAASALAIAIAAGSAVAVAIVRTSIRRIL